MILETSEFNVHWLLLCWMWGNQKQGRRIISTIVQFSPAGHSDLGLHVLWFYQVRCGAIHLLLQELTPIVAYLIEIRLSKVWVQFPQLYNFLLSDTRISFCMWWAAPSTCRGGFLETRFTVGRRSNRVAGKFDRFKKWPLLVKLFILRLQPIAFTIFAICTVAITDFEASTK